MAYTHAKLGTKYTKAVGVWNKTSMWGSADNVELAADLTLLPTNMNSATTLEAFLTAFENAFAAANGFATLDGTSKLTASQLPSSVAGGLAYSGTIDASTQTLDDLATLLGGTTGDKSKYVVVTTAGVISDAATTAKWELNTYDDGETINSATLEVGDKILCTNYDTDHHVFTLLNVNYGDASTTAKGIVTLSSAATRAALSGDKAVTEGILATILNDDLLVDGDFGATPGFMKVTGDGTYTVDVNTYLTSLAAAISQVLTGYTEAVAFAEVTSSDTILSALEQLAYTAKTAYNWGDHSVAGYQDAGAAIGINESGVGANADSLIQTFNYRDGAAAQKTIQVFAEGTDGKLHMIDGAGQDMPIAGVLVQASVPTTEGNDGDICIVTA